MSALLSDAESIAAAVDVDGSGRISLSELTAYFAGVNVKYGRDSDGSKEAASILSVLNPSSATDAASPTYCSTKQFANYLTNTFRKYPDKLARLLPIAQQVRDASLISKTAALSSAKALPPPWITGQMEAPAGTKDMGGWTKAIFTAEQQARLGVNEEGQKTQVPSAPASDVTAAETSSPTANYALGGNFVGGPAVSTPPWVRGVMEAPAGSNDMGGWTRHVFTAEQQARLGVDENGQRTEAVEAPGAVLPAPAPTQFLAEVSPKIEQ